MLSQRWRHGGESRSEESYTAREKRSARVIDTRNDEGSEDDWKPKRSSVTATGRTHPYPHQRVEQRRMRLVRLEKFDHRMPTWNLDDQEKKTFVGPDPAIEGDDCSYSEGD